MSAVVATSATAAALAGLPLLSRARVDCHIVAYDLLASGAVGAPQSSRSGQRSSFLPRQRHCCGGLLENFVF